MYMFFCPKDMFPTQDLDISSLDTPGMRQQTCLFHDLQEDTRDGRDYILRVTGMTERIWGKKSGPG